MIDPNTIMPDIVGQPNLKSIVAFHLAGYKNNGYFPSMMVTSSMGEGKTTLLMSVAKELKKPNVLVNSSTIASVDSFVKNLIFDMIIKFPDGYSIIADEFHEIDKKVQAILLTLLAQSKDFVNTYTHTKDGNSVPVTLDLRKVTFLAATTDPQKIFPPLRDRFRIYGIENYTKNDLKQILWRNSKDIVEIDDEAMDDIMNYVRVNPRSCRNFATDISQYCLGKSGRFTVKEWVELKNTMHFKRYGLLEMEEKLLFIIALHPNGARLTTLAAFLRVSKQTVQDAEYYLLNQGLITISNSIRMPTEKGLKYLHESKHQK